MRRSIRLNRHRSSGEACRVRDCQNGLGRTIEPTRSPAYCCKNCTWILHNDQAHLLHKLAARNYLVSVDGCSQFYLARDYLVSTVSRTQGPRLSHFAPIRLLEFPQYSLAIFVPGAWTRDSHWSPREFRNLFSMNLGRAYRSIDIFALIQTCPRYRMQPAYSQCFIC